MNKKQYKVDNRVGKIRIIPANTTFYSIEHKTELYSAEEIIIQIKNIFFSENTVYAAVKKVENDKLLDQEFGLISINYFKTIDYN